MPPKPPSETSEPDPDLPDPDWTEPDLPPLGEPISTEVPHEEGDENAQPI